MASRCHAREGYLVAIYGCEIASRTALTLAPLASVASEGSATRSPIVSPDLISTLVTLFTPVVTGCQRTWSPWSLYTPELPEFDRRACLGTLTASRATCEI